MRQVYLAHPVGGDVAANLASARRWMLWAFRSTAGQDVNFVANWIPVCEVLDDADPADRARGIAGDLDLLARCDEVWLVGSRISSGMAAEAEHGQRLGKRVRDFTAPEVPEVLELYLA